MISIPVVVESGDSYSCFWRMPFRTSARVEKGMATAHAAVEVPAEGAAQVIFELRARKP